MYHLVAMDNYEGTPIGEYEGEDFSSPIGYNQGGTDYAEIGTPVTLDDKTAYSQDAQSYQQVSTAVKSSSDTCQQEKSLFEGLTAPCPNLFKTSVHVFVACLGAAMLPESYIIGLTTKVPQLQRFGPVFVRSLLTVIMFIIINRLLSGLL